MASINISRRFLGNRRAGPVDKDSLVQLPNDEMATLMIPATVYISLLMVLGFVGNLFVCYYYTFQSKRSTNSFFIVMLAVYDLIVCSISMPTEIADIEHIYRLGVEKFLESVVGCFRLIWPYFYYNYA